MNKPDPTETIFEQALGIDSPPAREAYLRQACAGNEPLFQSLQALLSVHDRAGKFMDPRPQAGSNPSIAALLGTASVPVTEKPGDRIGRYKLLEKIGEGGCGVVYMAEQEEPVRRRVALKVIKLGMDTEAVIARFEAERQALAMMDHPNIAKVFDAGATESPLPSDGRGIKGEGHSPLVRASKRSGDGPTPHSALPSGRPYFVMELVRGTKITEFCDHNNLTTAARLELFMQVCRAIQHAHQKGIIHRDIKPSNILVTLHDGVPVPKVIDFGIAKATQGRLTNKTVFTAFHQFLGTPAYMSPEQAEMSSLDIDTRSDIYSLGVLLYELLTGKTPFDSKVLLEAGLDAMRRTIREQEPERPSTKLSTMVAGELTITANRRQTEPPKLVHAVRGDLDWIVMKALEKDRRRRYETANGLALDLQRHLASEPVTARPQSNLYRFQKMVRRNKLAFAAGTAVGLSLLIGLAVSTWMFFQEREAKREQVRLRQQAQANETKAQANEQRAQTEASKSQQVAKFLKEMLIGVGPSVALGRDTVLLKEILDRTAQRVAKDLKDQPEVEAELLDTIGNTYSEMNEEEKAEEMLREALRLRKAYFGETNALVASTLFDLAWTLRNLGKAAEAEAAYREALAMRRILFGNDSLEVANTLGYLAVLISGGHSPETRDKEAEAMFRETLRITKKILGDNSAEEAICLDQLGDLLASNGKLIEAEKMHRDALAIRKKLMGSDSPAVAESLVDLAIVLTEAGKLSEADTLEIEAMAIFEKLVNQETLEPIITPEKLDALDPFTVSPARLGILLQNQGKLAEAESVFRVNLSLQEKLFGKVHRGVDRPLRSLLVVLLQEGKIAEAKTVVERWGKLVDNKQIPMLNELAWFLATCDSSTLRDGPRAVGFAERAVTATSRTNSMMLDTLAAAYGETRQFEKAVSVQKEAIALLLDKREIADYASRLALYVANKPYHEPGFVADPLALNASYLLKAGKFTEAEKPARECLAIREREVPDDWLMFNSRSLLGGALLGQKKYAEAEPLLLSGYDGLKRREDKIPAAGKVRLKEALQRLVDLYQATDRHNQAAECKKKLAEFGQAQR